MHGSFTSTRGINTQLMRVEIRSQFGGSKRVGTFGSQPPQSETNGNWTDAASIIIIIIIIIILI